MVIYYKSVRLIGEKPRWVIEDKDGNIINKNPTKEQVRSAIDAKYRSEKCHKCGDATIPGRRRYDFCDLSPDREYDIIQSKLRTPYCGEIYKDWKVSFGTEHHFNTLFVLCVSKDRKNIERVYAILEKELYGLNGIRLTRSYSKYDKFRIDEKHDAHHSLMEFLKDKYFGIEDIKKWLEKED